MKHTVDSQASRPQRPPLTSRAFGQALRAGLLAVMVAAGLVLAPQVLGLSWLSFFTGVFLWSALGIVWAMLVRMGYISLATASWFGLGAYSTAVLMNHFGLSFLVSLPVTFVWVSVVAAVVSVPLLRLRSHYFIMGTFVTAEITRLLVGQARFFGLQGAAPVQLPAPTVADPSQFNAYFFRVAALFLIATMLLVIAIRRSRSGYAIRIIGGDEDTAQLIGVPTARYKLLMFAGSSGVTALGGGIFAYWTGYLVPSTAFSISTTVNVLVVSVVGGIGALGGPIIGALGLQFLSERLGPDLADLGQLFLGVAVIAIVVLMPRGIVAAMQSLYSRLRGRSPRDRQ